MKRRAFLKGVLGTGVAVGSCLFRNPLLSSAHAASIPTLVVVFQRGGCDGLNTVVPFGDPDYYALRPTIAIPQPGDGSFSALNLNDFFWTTSCIVGLFANFQRWRFSCIAGCTLP